MNRSGHVDRFAADRLPPKEEWPDLLFSLPELQYPERLNCAGRLLDRHIASGRADRRCLLAPGEVWSYRDLFCAANQIAHVLQDDFGVVPGNRVLLRAPNTPMLAACWFAVMKSGAIAVTSMPVYRAAELKAIVEKAQIRHALCDARLTADLHAAVAGLPGFSVLCFGGGSAQSLESRMREKPVMFQNVDTAAEDVAIIAFTSGTTGKPKATLHFHRDIMAICDTYGKRVLRAASDDLFTGSPPLAFTFGLGGILLFPLHAGAATLLLEKAQPQALLEAIERHRVSVLFTAPVAYRAMAEMLGRFDASSLRKCVSAGETLPLTTWGLWRRTTGLPIMDGIGSTEMLHIFIGSPDDRVKGGSTGEPVPGYEAQIHDDDGTALPSGEIGRLAVKGPTGCRYLDDDRQTGYVRNGWNYPGDAYRADDEGYFWYVARTDDMIIAAGYNISGPEVEEALLTHREVKECAVIAKPDKARSTNLIKAYVVLCDATVAGEAKGKELQEFVRARIAPFKAPREVEFVSEIPRTETGKVQRFKLRQRAAEE